jgi:transposase
MISMSTKELRKVEVIGKLAQKVINQEQAAQDLGVSDRQIRRLLKKYRKSGASGLISQKRGRPSNHQLPKSTKELTLALIQKHYCDFGPTLAHEKVTEKHGVNISVGSVRRMMIAAGLWVDKKVKKQCVHQLRKRRSQEGELVQMDGSPHDWFEGRAPYCTLIQCVDDATGKILAALFVASEGIWTYFSLMRQYLKKHGRPRSFYVDKHAVFRVNAVGPLTGEGVTQFGRAMKELGIELIFANSAPAKGRIERANQTLQDRPVKEMRLRGISTIDAGNSFLPEFLDNFNRRFAVVPQNPNNAHQPLLKDQDLDLIFTIQSIRVLSKNLTLSFKNVIYQIHSEKSSYVLRKARVCIREKESGEIEILYRGKSLKFSTYHYQEKQGEVADSKRLNEVVNNLQFKQKKAKYKPSNRHPWKRCAKGPATVPPC